LIDLQSGVWAMAVWHSAQVTTSTGKSLISILVNPGLQWNPAGSDGVAGPIAIISIRSKSLCDFFAQSARNRASCPSAVERFSHAAHDEPARCPP
jgi:hypothetical protein